MPRPIWPNEIKCYSKVRVKKDYYFNGHLCGKAGELLTVVTPGAGMLREPDQLKPIVMADSENNITIGLEVRDSEGGHMLLPIEYLEFIK